MANPRAIRIVRRISPLLLAAAAACAGHRHAPIPEVSPDGGRLITREAIRRSGARNAWEAVRRNARHLLIRESAQGGPVRVTHRGVTSFSLSNEVLFVVDDTYIYDFRYLENIPAASIESIEILTGARGTVLYGTSAGNGAVVVRTGPPAGEPGSSLVT